MPLLKEGSIDIPKRWHIHSGKHILDIFRKWSSSNGLKLMTGLLQYNPAKRWTADEALASKYFSELVSRLVLRFFHFESNCYDIHAFHLLQAARTDSIEPNAHISDKAFEIINCELSPQ